VLEGPHRHPSDPSPWSIRVKRKKGGGGDERRRTKGVDCGCSGAREGLYRARPDKGGGGGQKQKTYECCRRKSSIGDFPKGSHRLKSYARGKHFWPVLRGWRGGLGQLQMEFETGDKKGNSNYGSNNWVYKDKRHLKMRSSPFGIRNRDLRDGHPTGFTIDTKEKAQGERNCFL